MKILKPVFLAFLVVSSASAAEVFDCPVRDGNGKMSELRIVFETMEEALVITESGDEYTLEEARGTSKNRIYANYEYDGYGGSVELRVPKGLTTSGSEATEEFNASLKIERFSEAGHISTEAFKGVCSRIDN